MSCAICFSLDQSKILFSGNELTLSKMTKILALTKLKALAEDKFNIA